MSEKKPVRRAAKKKPTAKKKPSRKKPTAKLAARKKPAVKKKPAAKKPSRKKPTAKKKPTRKKPAAKRLALKKPGKKPTARQVRAAHLAELDREARTALDANEVEAAELVADIVRRKKRIADDFHAIGLALARLSDKRLYHALGYRNFADLLKGRRLFSSSAAYRLMAIADAYPRELAHNLGVDKAYKLIAYVEATPAPDLARTLAVENPRIGNKRLHRMTSRELEDAARRVRATAGTARKATSAEREARRAARKVQQSLRARGAKTAKASAARIAGRWRISIDLAVEDADIVR